MLKVSVWQANFQSAHWGLLRNTFYLKGSWADDVQGTEDYVYPLARLVSRLSLQTHKVVFCSWCNAYGPGPATSVEPGFGSTFTGRQTQGERVQDGVLWYKNVLRVPIYTATGKPGQLWFRGCLDTGDIRTNPHGKRMLRNPMEFKNLIELTTLENPNFWNNELLVPRSNGTISGFGGPGRNCYIAQAFLTESHAQTRRRRLLTGSGVAAVNSMMLNLIELTKNYNDSDFWVSYDRQYTPPENFSYTVNALAMVMQTSQQVEQFCSLPYPGGVPGMSEPYSRFGPTWGAIMGVWKAAGERVRKELPRLLADHNLIKYAGDYYISSSDLAPYHELRKSLVKQLCTTLDGDWWNPYCYEGQLQSGDLKRRGDLIDLLF